MRFLFVFFCLTLAYSIAFSGIGPKVDLTKDSFCEECFIESFVLNQSTFKKAYAEFSLYKEYQEYFVSIYQQLNSLEVYCPLLCSYKELGRSLHVIYPNVTELILQNPTIQQIQDMLANYKTIHKLIIVDGVKGGKLKYQKENQKIVLPENILELDLSESNFSETLFCSNQLVTLRIGKWRYDYTVIKKQFQNITKFYRNGKILTKS